MTEKPDWVVILGLIFVAFMVVVVFPAASRKEAEYQNYRAIVEPLRGER